MSNSFGVNLDDLAARLNGEESPATEEVLQVAPVTLEAEAESQQPEVPQELEPEQSVMPEPHSEDDEGGHKVPYQRFQRINNQRKELQDNYSSLQRQYAELETQMKGSNVQNANVQTETESSSWLDDIIGDDEQGNQYKQLESRLEHFEMAQAQTQLEQELSSVKEAYPNIPDALLLNAVIQDPNAKMMDVANNYNAYIAGIEEQAISRYVESNPLKAQKRDVAPRPKTSAGVTTSTSPMSPTGQKNTMTNARDNLAAALKNNNIFN